MLDIPHNYEEVKELFIDKVNGIKHLGRVKLVERNLMDRLTREEKVILDNYTDITECGCCGRGIIHQAMENISHHMRHTGKRLETRRENGKWIIEISFID